MQYPSELAPTAFWASQTSINYKSEDLIERFNNPMLVAVVEEDSSQRNIRVVTDASEEWTTEKVEVVVKKM